MSQELKGNAESNQICFQHWPDTSVIIYYPRIDSISAAEFDSAHFLSEVVFVDANFFCDANFNLAVFKDDVYFIDAQFDSEADFSRARFDSIADFFGASFYSHSNFRSAKFDSEADFSSARFDSIADFFRARFYSYSNFRSAKFDSEADFLLARFDSIAYFNSARFSSIAYFRLARFNSSADFRRARFDSIADFSNAKFKSGADFGYSFLPTNLNLSKISIENGIIDLSAAIALSDGRECLINLVGTELQKIKLRYLNFRLHFPDTISIPWPEKENMYVQLLTLARNEGFIKSYEKLDKEYRKTKYFEKHSRPNRLYNFVDRWWWDYGYKKHLILRNSMTIYILFSIINLFFLNKLLSNVYTIEKIKTSLQWTHLWGFNLVMLKLYYSLFYTGLIFFGVTFSIANLHYSGKVSFTKIAGITYFILLYISGLICLGYMSNFIITI